MSAYDMICYLVVSYGIGLLSYIHSCVVSYSMISSVIMCSHLFSWYHTKYDVPGTRYDILCMAARDMIHVISWCRVVWYVVICYPPLSCIRCRRVCLSFCYHVAVHHLVRSKLPRKEIDFPYHVYIAYVPLSQVPLCP